jgi:hypothetical protein
MAISVRIARRPEAPGGKSGLRMTGTEVAANAGDQPPNPRSDDFHVDESSL